MIGIKKYIGDGVYASYDGFHIWLSTERLTGQHYIALDDTTYASLVAFVDECKQRTKDASDERKTTQTDQE